ncbi:hypothetical protein [Gemmata obscuriglobus]|uniref:Uncharacterized protein n=1 Tax=Gemmata obscuriglobus TaxID=114 RepID=A0A2Z3H4I4_9BACT|nr:hypothetical protein [Gemmata obscuriglobus]AWM38617.1 hypothetical protein C1280_17580 [Gemmata obscuriglobus]
MWWRKVALASVGGTVAVGGLFGIVRATSPEKTPVAPAAPVVTDTTWSRAAAPSPVPPSVSRLEHAPVAPGSVVPAGAAVPVPLPPVPSVPVPAAPPALPPVPSVPSAIEPIGSGPRAPDAGLLNADKIPLPPVPSIELPSVPSIPKVPDPKPAALPAPAELPALPTPLGTVDPPKIPTSPPAPAVPSAVLPFPAVAPPAGAAPLPLPAPSPDPAKAVMPVKPDSGLNRANPQNTLNPSSPAGPPAPTAPPTGPGGRDVPATTVDRPKPPEPVFGTTEKFVFPAPGATDPGASTPRDATMLNLKHAAAAAILGGAILGAEPVRAAPAALVPAAQTPAADDKVSVEQLKTDLKAASDRIKKLEEQVEKLEALVLGKKDPDGKRLTNSLDRGAVADVVDLKDKINKLEKELSSLKTQTALKPAVETPEVKPKGIVRVVNEYPVEITMLINDRTHRVAPSTKVDVEVPAGDFSYQLLQSGAAVTRSVIKDKETVTLRIK